MASGSLNFVYGYIHQSCSVDLYVDLLLVLRKILVTGISPVQHEQSSSNSLSLCVCVCVCVCVCPVKTVHHICVPYVDTWPISRPLTYSTEKSIQGISSKLIQFSLWEHLVKAHTTYMSLWPTRPLFTLVKKTYSQPQITCTVRHKVVIIDVWVNLMKLLFCIP